MANIHVLFEMNLKTLATIFLFITSIKMAAAGTTIHDTVKTEIYIIGVNHRETPVRNADSLMIVLQEIRPDLILSETDTLSGYFKKDYTLVHPSIWYKLRRKLSLARKMAPEDDVVYKYLKHDPSVLVLPFDMAIPDRTVFVTKLIKEEQAWVDAVQKNYEIGNIPMEFDSAYRSLIDVYGSYSIVSEGSHRDLNRKSLTDSLRSARHLEQQLSKTLVDSVLALAKFKEWQDRHYRFWDHRNEIMAMNLIRFANKTGAKRMVVFTGLLHKYYLTDVLTDPRFSERFELKEYYEE